MGDVVSPAENKSGLQFHAWPEPEEHLWSDWMSRTGMPNPTKWRKCLHPKCDAAEIKNAVIAPT